ncbi:MAG: hypothetical protein ABL893_14225 [Hyphomicrobium sp.]
MNNQGDNNGSAGSELILAVAEEIARGALGIIRQEALFVNQVESAVLVPNSVVYAASEKLSVGETFPSEPTLPARAVIDVSIAGLKGTLGNVECAANVGGLDKLAFTLCELQFAVDATFLAFGMGDVKPRLLSEMYASRMAAIDPKATPYVPDWAAILNLPERPPTGYATVSIERAEF